MPMNDHPPVIDYEGSDYQATFWDKGDRDYEDQVEAIALRRLLPGQGKLLLEIGAGAGRNTSRYLGFERIVLLDYSRSQLRLAQERLGRGERYLYVAADVYHMPFVPGLFDGATMIRTLHHMADVSRALCQVRRVMEPGGHFILEYANKKNLKAILRYMARRQSWNPFDHQPVEYLPLNFDFHPKQIHDSLTTCDFEIQQQLTVSHFRIDLLKRLLPTSLLVQMDAIAQRTGNLWQLSPSVFLRAQAGGQSELAAPGAFFACPECATSSLIEAADSLNCSICQRSYPIEDGVYNFRV
jgi:ubiquinone/menaquinone biosynthesis C-methylase UbiE